MAIPRRIITIWLNENPKLPSLIERCSLTHNLPNYEHIHITLDNCYRNKYIEDAIRAKQWGKAADFLRIHYLYKLGGIHIDMDVEMLPGKNFDLLLDKRVFACRENNGFINTAVLGAEKGTPVLKDHLKEVVTRFRGDDGLYFESSIEIFTPRIEKTDATILPAEYFYPYDWQRQTVNITKDTICYHHFARNWLTKP
jgi:mannosyltransferase OCH1-like enzyme